MIKPIVDITTPAAKPVFTKVDYSTGARYMFDMKADAVRLQEVVAKLYGDVLCTHSKHTLLEIAGRMNSGKYADPLPNTPEYTPPVADKSPTDAPGILDKASQHMRDRAATYDKPEGERSMAKTVDVFNAFHGTTLTEEQGWHFMQILKDVRFFTRPGYHADSAEDAVAYAGLKAEARAKGQS